MMSEQLIGTIVGIAIRSAKDGPMKEVSEAVAVARGGIEGDLPSSPARGITLMSSVQWQQVIGQLGEDLPWHTRRANVLVEAPELGELIGRKILLGGVELKVEGETKPCGLMDRICPGLREVLVPDCRGGVHGSVVLGGCFKIGDRLIACD